MDQNALTVIVIDDEPVILYAAQEILSQAGFRVLSFESPKKALETIKNLPESSPLTLVVDVELPEMSGFDVHKEISTLRPKLPTIFISGYHSPENWQKEPRENTHFITKPFDFQKLIDIIKDLSRSGEHCS